MKSIILLCLVAFASAAFDNTSPAQYIAWLKGGANANGAQGACVVRYEAATMMLGVLCHHNISTSDTVTAAHIHGPTANPATASVGVLVGLTVATQGPGSIYFTAAAVTLYQACNISMSMTYVNIHTTAAPGGLIRGVVQTVAASGYTHAATLDNVQASVGTTITDTGVGLIKRMGTTLWVTLFHRMTILPMVGEHIHVTPTSAIVYSICGAASSPYRNCTQMDTAVVGWGVTELAANVAALDGGMMYFNVHTAAHPGGQIRGQITMVAAATGPSNAQCTGAGSVVQASLSVVALLAVALALFQ